MRYHLQHTFLLFLPPKTWVLVAHRHPIYIESTFFAPPRAYATRMYGAQGPQHGEKKKHSETWGQRVEKFLKTNEEKVCLNG